MIETLRGKLPLSIFEEVSSTDHGFWNDDLTIFTPYFQADNRKYNVLDNYKKAEKYIDAGFYSRLLLLADLGIIEDIKSSEFLKLEGNHGNSNNPRILYEHHIKYSIHKLNLLKAIVHDNDNLELKVSRKLIDVILYLHNKYSISKESYPFIIKTIQEELSIDNQNYIFNNFEILVYSIATYKGALIKKLVSYLINSIKEADKDLLLKALENDDVIKLKIFWYEKRNKGLYIYHRSGQEFKIKTIELESDYDFLAQALMNTTDGLVFGSKIKETFQRNITDLADTKKFLKFNRILNKLFFNFAKKDKLSFNKIVYQETLERKNLQEKDVLDYLKRKFG